MPLNEEGFISRVSLCHSVSPDAVRTILRALRSGGGSMAQFSHPDFGGMSQWSPGMSMVGDMFNNSLKSKLDAVCTELAAYVAETRSTEPGVGRKAGEVSYRSSQGSDWWPGALGTPSLAQSAHKMIFSTQFSRALEDWRSKPADISKYTIPATTKSSEWPKRKAQTGLLHSPAKMVLSGSVTYRRFEDSNARIVAPNRADIGGN